jgi:hypothetical protein
VVCRYQWVHSVSRSIVTDQRVAVNSGATSSLSTAVSAVDASYNSSLAITFMGSEARNENI